MPPLFAQEPLKLIEKLQFSNLKGWEGGHAPALYVSTFKYSWWLALLLQRFDRRCN
jgi:hypothetical protein